MTVPGSSVVPADTYGYASGLEDLDASDLRMPRLSIDHDAGAFTSSVSDEKFEYMTVVPLGVVKQRVLWQSVMGDNNLGPMCKSPNSKEGYPTLKGQDEELFPWAASGFSINDFPPNPDGRAVVPCTSCRLAQWKSHPDGKKAWCSEQWIIPVLYGVRDDEPQITALLTAQRSSLAPVKLFFGGLVQRNKPAFAMRVKIGLVQQQRGKTKYCVPTWGILGGTVEDEWPVYSQSFLAIKEYVSRPPRGEEIISATAVADSNVVQGTFTATPTWAPGAATTPAVTQPVVTHQPVMTQQAPVASPVNQTARDNDDLPF